MSGEIIPEGVTLGLPRHRTESKHGEWGVGVEGGYSNRHQKCECSREQPEDTANKVSTLSECRHYGLAARQKAPEFFLQSVNQKPRLAQVELEM